MADNSFFLQEESTLQDMVNNNKAGPTYTNSLERGVGEDFMLSYNTAIGIAFDEDMSFSPFLNNEDRAKRDSTIHGRILEKGTDDSGNPLIPDHVLDYYRDNMDGLAVYMRDQLGMSDIKTDEELLADKKEMLGQRRGYAEEVWQTQSTGGKVGQFMGQMTAFMVDPVYLPGYFVGVSQVARGVQLAKSVGAVALAEGSSEALKQAFVTKPYKNELGIDYNWDDAAMEVAMAAVGSASLEVGVMAIGKGIKRLFGKVDKTTIPSSQRKQMDDIQAEADVEPYKVNEVNGERDNAVHSRQTKLNIEKPDVIETPATTSEQFKAEAANTPENMERIDTELKDTTPPEPLIEAQTRVEDVDAVIEQGKLGNCNIQSKGKSKRTARRQARKAKKGGN